MPTELPESWEYWVPGEEWAEAFGDEFAHPHPFASFWDDRAGESRVAGRGRRFVSGFRFGCGDPDRHRPFRVVGNWVFRETKVPDVAACDTCGCHFRPERVGRRYCSPLCVPRPGRKRVLGDRECLRCGAVFRPLHPGHRYCTHACFNRGQRERNAPAGGEPGVSCRECGGPVGATRSRNGVPRVFCAPACKKRFTGRQWRQRRAGGASRG